MLRITILFLAGALIAGCQESDLQQITAHHGGVQGEKSYGNEVQGSVAYRDQAVYGDPKYTSGKISGDQSFATNQQDVTLTTDPTRKVVTRTEMSRSDLTPADNARTASVRTETVTNTPATPSEVRTS